VDQHYVCPDLEYTRRALVEQQKLIDDIEGKKVLLIYSIDSISKLE